MFSTLSEVAEVMALLSWLPPGAPRDVLASPLSTGVLPLISSGTLFWPLVTQKDLRSGPSRAIVTVRWRGRLVPSFGCGGGRAAHWGHLCPGAPAATASHRAGRKGFSTHCLSWCIRTEAICLALTMAGSTIFRSWQCVSTLIFEV